MALLGLRIPRDLDAVRENVVDKLRRRPIADLTRTPRDIVDQRSAFTLYRYGSAPGVETHGLPVLFIPPLAAPALAFDLRRTCSVVEYFVNQGRPVYLADYGAVEFKHRNLGFEHWGCLVGPAAGGTVSAPGDRADVDGAGWSLGGIFSMFAAAAQ